MHTLCQSLAHTKLKFQADIVSHCKVVILAFLFQFACPTSLPLAVPPAARL